MKYCPNCRATYEDDTLRFCLEDGTPLSEPSTAQMPTAAFNETETVLSNRKSNPILQETRPTHWQPSQDLPFQPISVTPPPKSNTGWAVFLTAFLMLLVFGGIGIGAWIYLNGTGGGLDGRGNVFLANRPPDNSYKNSSNTVSSTPLTSRTPANTNSPASNVNMATPQIDKEQLKKDVSERLYKWKSLAESRDLNSYMDCYAPTIAYYNKGSASKSAVRADKERAFTTYSSIRINLTNMNISINGDGETATAVFDKEWFFLNSEKTNSGKVQAQLQLKKINGQWLISGEKDLKVYYVDK